MTEPGRNARQRPENVPADLSGAGDDYSSLQGLRTSSSYTSARGPSRGALVALGVVLVIALAFVIVLQVAAA